jgi:peptide-methionine (R)-S-oxide reductase
MQDEFKKKLSEERYRILREAGTEPPFSGEYVDHHEDGSYACGACGATLFESDKKFDSECGWPSFYDVASNSAIRLVEDRSHGMRRVEVRCAKCDSHLGHVFKDAPEQPTGLRYCINSLALDFHKKGEKK